jgi:methylmalonyl-CoA mutase N-terminal domain/subunit
VKRPERRAKFETTSGVELPPVWPTHETPAESPGEYPFTRGVYPNMYRGRFWTMRQYSGFGTSAETNRRFRYLLEQGGSGLSVAFDLPTQMGYDSDDAEAAGEVGRTGVAVDTIHDMEILVDGIPLESAGTIQNDLLKEYIARGTYIFPPKPSLRLTADIFRYCRERVPRWNTISISGYHIREAGSTAAQEIAFTFANAKEYVRAGQAAGLAVDEFAPRLSFFFNVHNQFLEEVAKFRAARRLWARIMREEFGAKDPKSWMLRFHSQTAGSTLTAQEPLNNVVRTTLQALAAVAGGTQSLHTNSFDEALGLPTADAAKLALRTQQVIAEESGVADVVDPFGGSDLIEGLTDEVEKAAVEYLDRIEELGGAVAAIEQAYQTREIEEAAFTAQRAIEAGDAHVVGVNVHAEGETQSPPVFKVDPKSEEDQKRVLAERKASRDQDLVRTRIAAVKEAATGDGPIMEPIVDALRAEASLGEVCHALRAVWGTYHP